MIKTPRNWDQLLESELAAKARAHTFAYPFDLPLGKAVVTHDVVYDEHPQKEWRSAEWPFSNDEETKTNIEAAPHIMKTAGLPRYLSRFAPDWNAP